ncbi:MAG TPA: phosphate/phosphite/phosphonate ABC transporter substrate-binding protein [Pseudobdellovibrionaceae bacterium]|jgi:phosphonate transport system substrate-binding protein
MKKGLRLLVVLTSAVILAACTGKKAELGTAENPIKIHFVPSVDAKVIEDGSKLFKAFLEKNTPYKYEISMPQSFVAVVEAFGTKRADVAAINTFGYVLAHDKYGAEARMTVIRHGFSTYQSQFIAKADGPIKSIADLAGKKVAFVDPSSTSGYLLPLKTLKTKKIEPKETVFAMKHDSVVSMIYQGQVDGGATFYSPPSKDEKGNEQLEDARRLVLTQYPDVEKKIKILELSEPIPNDPIIFRKDMPEEIKAKVVDAIFAFVSTPEGKDAFNKIYGVTEFKKSTDADYEPVRKMLNELGKNAADLMKK